MAQLPLEGQGGDEAHCGRPGALHPYGLGVAMGHAARVPRGEVPSHAEALPTRGAVAGALKAARSDERFCEQNGVAAA